MCKNPFGEEEKLYKLNRQSDINGILNWLIIIMNGGFVNEQTKRWVVGGGGVVFLWEWVTLLSPEQMCQLNVMFVCLLKTIRFGKIGNTKLFIPENVDGIYIFIFTYLHEKRIK